MPVTKRLVFCILILSVAAIAIGCSGGVPYSVSGCVIDETGNRLSGVTVVATGSYGEKRATTNSNGQWAIYGLNYTSVIYAEHSQMTFYAGGPPYTAWETWYGGSGFNFIGRPGFTASGHFYDVNRDPVPYMVVDFTEETMVQTATRVPCPRGARPIYRGTRSVTADSAGFWQMEGLGGTVHVKPHECAPWRFDPAERVLSGGPAYNVNFTASQSPFTGAASVAVGEYSALVVRTDGTVWQWKLDPYHYYPYTGPAQVPGLAGTSCVAAGMAHYIAVTASGVFAWGSNEFGQLGIGTKVESSLPVSVQGLTSVVEVAAGAAFSLALTSEGDVWAWGSNQYGELGDGTGGSGKYTSVPIKVSGLSGVRSIAARGSRALAVTNDGTVWVWGGREGDYGVEMDSPIPVEVEGLSGIVAIATGEYHSMALKNDGTVWVWGDNRAGQLGEGSCVDSPTPIQLSSLDGVKAIAAGSSLSAALKADGSVWYWGNSKYLFPVRVGSIPAIVAVSCSSSTMMAISSNHMIWSWVWGDSTAPAPVAIWP